jgi:hypothetical protein
MDSQIKYKKEEMAFFLDEMEKSFQEDQRFRYMYSAFLSAGQSALYYLITRYEGKDGFKDWYYGKKTGSSKMRTGGRIDKPEIKHLMNARGHAIHIGRIGQGATNEMICGIKAFVADPKVLKEQVDKIVPIECMKASGPKTVARWLTDEELYMHYKNKSNKIINDTHHIPTLKCQYSSQPNEPTKTDILKLSKAEVEEIKTLITECETLFQ